MLSFNFDLLIVIIVLLSIIKGYNRGIYRQIASTASMAVPIIVLQIWGLTLFTLVSKLNIFNDITSFCYNIFKAIANIDLHYIQIVFLYAIIYLILFFIIKLVFNIFGPSKRTNLLGELSNTSKGVASVIGMVAAYFIIVIGFTFIKPITNIDTDKPITALIIKSNSILNNDLNIELPQGD